jgi:hypothetical protein
MQFSQKSELKPAFLLPKTAILALIFPKIKRLRPLPNKVRKITAFNTIDIIALGYFRKHWKVIRRNQKSLVLPCRRHPHLLQPSKQVVNMCLPV